MVNVFAARSPVAVVVARLRRGLVQETGTSLPATEIVGWPAAVLHSRRPPVALSSKRDPLTLTTVPLINPVFGVTVTLGPVGADVVVVVVDAVVVVVVADVVVVVGDVVVVVVGDPPPNEMTCVASSPSWSPKAMVQVSPSDTCAAVGGHG
jgi:hypothetical protein